MRRIFDAIALLSLVVFAWSFWGMFVNRAWEFDILIDPPMQNRARVALVWPLTIAAIVFAAWYARVLIVEKRLRDRRANNQCISCGYDLRSSPERCPECGTVANAGSNRYNTARAGNVDRDPPV